MIISAKNPRIVVRPATALDIERLYQKANDETLRAWVMDVDDEPAAIGGVSFTADGHPLIFSRLTDKIRPYKLAIFKGARLLLQRLALRRYPMFAVADPGEATSRNLLAYLGMKLVTCEGEYAIYRFKPLHGKEA
jgi:hypothetical protein